MKLTKQTLKRIIKEELDAVVNEQDLDEGLFDFFKGKSKEEPQEQPQKNSPVLDMINRRKAGAANLNPLYRDLFVNKVNGVFLDQNGRLLIRPESENDEDYEFAVRLVRSIDRWASKLRKWKQTGQGDSWVRSHSFALGFGGNRNPTQQAAKSEADAMFEKLKQVKSKYK